MHIFKKSRILKKKNLTKCIEKVFILAIIIFESIPWAPHRPPHQKRRRKSASKRTSAGTASINALCNDQMRGSAESIQNMWLKPSKTQPGTSQKLLKSRAGAFLDAKKAPKRRNRPAKRRPRVSKTRPRAPKKRPKRAQETPKSDQKPPKRRPRGPKYLPKSSLARPKTSF